MPRRGQCEGYRGKIIISLFAFRAKCWFGGSNSVGLRVFYRLLRYVFRTPQIDPSGPGGPIAARTSRGGVFSQPDGDPNLSNTCFLGPIATRTPRNDVFSRSDSDPGPSPDMLSRSDGGPGPSK